ncbi:hypothetical protein [Cohnella sp. GCM10027633]|uniref:hypothetical protein n=1 Tax=unclassified Cohnella TaxID=2636738 RepID=UPI00364370B5
MESSGNGAFSLFESPTEAYRGKPFWSWNGELNQEEMLRQIRVFKEMGFGGFFMHSRTGLATEYLGDEWMDLTEACAEEAEKLGLEAWLYDEDRWPSGTAGGTVTADPAYRRRFIRLSVYPPGEYAGAEGAIAVFACRLEGLAVFDCLRLEDRDTETGSVDPSQWVLAFTIEEMAGEPFYNGNCYVDTMNADATARFLESTHEKYGDRIGRRFGQVVRGIFTDEPHRGAVMDGFGLRNRDAEWLTPWTDALFEAFDRRFGYGLEDRLPELFLHPEGRAVSQVKWHYMELLQQLFLDNFAVPVREWCGRNRMILTGHVLHEDSLSAQAAMCGSVMRYYEHMDYPGVDVLTEGNRCYWIVKQLSSAARQTGRRWLLSELYGCTGWQMNFKSHKAVGDWQALFGINLRCHHLSWYTMEGEAKRDYPASLSDQSAWWREYAYVETYFARLGVILSQGKPICDVLVLNPIESVWCQVYPGWSRQLEAQSPAVRQLERQYEDLFHWLAGARIDFDYGDEEMMARLGGIDADEDGRPVFELGQARYRTVVVGGMETMRSATLALLRRFREAGGNVLFVGSAPGYVDAVLSDEASALAADSTSVPFSRDETIAALRRLGSAGILVTDSATGQEIDDMCAQIREEGDVLYLVLLNMDGNRGKSGVRIRVPATGVAEEWHCATGTRTVVGAELEEDGMVIVADFPPGGERAFVIDRSKAPVSVPVAVRDVADFVRAGTWEGSFAYRLEEPNVCVLDYASLQRGEEPAREADDILRVDRAIRSEIGVPFRGGDMVQPWFAAKNGAREASEGYPVKLAFDFQAEHIPEGDVCLAIERPERFLVTVNGCPVTNRSTEGRWVDRCFVRLAIPSEALRLGDNRVVLETRFEEASQLEAIYVLGSFGVDLQGNRKTLTRLPEKLDVGDVAKQGLPFYGGRITYSLPRPVSDASGSEGIRDWPLVVSFPSYEAACLVVRDGREERVVAWEPCEARMDWSGSPEAKGDLEVDVVLTRRNTFGPLHMLPAVAPFYAPWSWLTEGDAYTDGYVLWPAGLLAAPEWRIVR